MEQQSRNPNLYTEEKRQRRRAGGKTKNSAGKQVREPKPKPGAKPTARKGKEGTNQKFKRIFVAEKGLSE